MNDRARETRTARAVVHGASVVSLSIASAHAGIARIEQDARATDNLRQRAAVRRHSTTPAQLQGPQAEPFVEGGAPAHVPCMRRFVRRIPGVADVMLQRLAAMRWSQ